MISILSTSEWWPAEQMEPLLEASRQEGFRFLDRLREEWLAGTNRFGREGETFCNVYDDGRLIAVGGINRQSDNCGRLRRFYVMKEHRRRGIGRSLARHLLEFAAQHYNRVVLRTTTEAADCFYLSLGFRRSAEEGVTHSVELGPKISISGRGSID